jgi:GT2 family glycosyltransferase
VRCSVIVPVYGQAALTRQCVDVLLAGRDGDLEPEVIVVDDGSRDETPELLRGYGDQIVVVRHETNLGFAASCNDGATVAAGDALVFLNNDTIPQAGWLEALLGFADAHPRAAAVGAKLLFPDDTVQHAGVVICQYGYPKNAYAGFPAWHPAVNKSRPFQAVTAACMLVRRSAFEQLGGFDTTYRNGFEDVDLCLRLGEKGHEVHYCHEAVAYHLESMSEGRFADSDHNRHVYERRWAGRVHSDDFRYYTADGLIGITYEDLYPLRIDLSPLLAVVEGDELTRRADALLGLRSRRNIELLREIERLNLRLLEAQGAESYEPPKLVAEGEAKWLSVAQRGPFISIVLVARDGAEWLAELLPSLAEQEAEVIAEIVAVDCGSVDDTMERLRDADARIVAVDALALGQVPLATVARYARGNVLVFLEQGVVPTGRDWLASLLSGFADDEVEAVCSPLPGLAGFHGAATAVRVGAIAADGVRECELETWPAAVLRAGLKVRIEPSALVSQRRPTALQLMRAAMAEGFRGAPDESEDDLVAAIRADWRALEEGAQLDGDVLEKARAEVAVLRVREEIGRSLRRTHRPDRERPWVEDAAAGKLAAGSWAEDSGR